MGKARPLLASIMVLTLLIGAAGLANATEEETSVSATKTAVGFYESVTPHDWTMGTFQVDPAAITIEPGQTGQLDLTVSVTRTAGDPFSIRGVRGLITVTNEGDFATVNLSLQDTVRGETTGGGMTAIMTRSWTPGYEVPADSVRDYLYEVEFDPTGYDSFTNRAYVHFDNSGDQSAVSNAEPFSMPSAVTDVDQDDTATVTFLRAWVTGSGDPADAPEGVSVGAASANLTDSTVATRSLTIGVSSTVAGDQTFYLKLTPVITADDTGTETVGAPITIAVYTGAPSGGGTVIGNGRGLGYWKNHAGEWTGKSPSANFYNSGKTWMEVLKTPPKRGDAYYLLARQYIAAYLNDQHGVAMSSSVRSAFNEAASYFAHNYPGELTGGRLSASDRQLRSEVLGLAGTLAAYTGN